jgi:hypothetical protein
MFTYVARSQLHGFGTFAVIQLSQIYPDSRLKDKMILRTQVSCAGEDVEAKFTSDEPHAVTTCCDWLPRLYLACLSMTFPRHMLRVLAIHRSMTRNNLARRRVWY